MTTIVDTLMGLFTTDNPEDRTPEALRQHIRDTVNADTTGDIRLDDEIHDGRSRFNELYQGGDFDPRHAPDMRMLSEIVGALKAVKAEQEEARAELDAEFSAAAADMGDTPPDPPADAANADPAADSTFSDTGDDGASTGDDGATADDTTGDAPDPDPADTTTASGPDPKTPKVRPAPTPVRLPTAGDINTFRNGPANTGAAAQVRRSYSIVAGADVPRTSSGVPLSMSELAQATIRRFQSMPLGQRVSQPSRGSIALIKRTFDRSLHTYMDNRDQGVIDKVANEKHLPGGSVVTAAAQARQNLTAAGCCTSMSNDIWCAPSETDYTLCEPLATLEGMVDLPTIPVNRGGIRYPVWTQLPFDWHGTVVENSCDDPIAPDYFETEANYKTCISGPCPTWEEVRLSIEYLCIEGDILKERGYPELTERFINDAMIAHAHYMNHNYLAHIFNNSDTIPGFDVSGTGIGSVSDSIIDRLGLLIAWMRERYKMAMDATLEGIAPYWLRTYIKADIARKNNRPYASVTDAEIDDLFAGYTTRVQWVYDTEGITEDATLADGTPIDGRPMPGAWPTNVEMVFYPAGSWVLGQQDVITLDALYDSEKLKRNKYTALFMEEGFLLLNRCNRSFRVRLTNLCRNGGVAELASVTCPENPPEPEAQTATAQTAAASGDTSSGDTTARTARRRS